MVNELIIHFGTKEKSLAELKNEHPNLKFSFVQQVHGTQIVQPSETITQADGLRTNKPNIAIAVQTADCLPILAYHAPSKTIWALHAGWRGLVQNIIPSAFADLKNLDSLHVWIGPHIKRDSFKVRKDTVDLFPEKFVKRLDAEFFTVDLTALAKHQLRQLGVENTWASPDNTYELTKYHSFRRDRTSGRQWSFIALAGPGNQIPKG